MPKLILLFTLVSFDWDLADLAGNEVVGVYPLTLFLRPKCDTGYLYVMEIPEFESLLELLKDIIKGLCLESL